MKTYRKELWFNVPSRVGFVNITPRVEECLRESGIREGLALVNAMHITASVFVNDDERGLLGDFEVWLEKLAPHEPVAQYRHNSGERMLANGINMVSGLHHGHEFFERACGPHLTPRRARAGH